MSFSYLLQTLHLCSISSSLIEVHKGKNQMWRRLRLIILDIISILRFHLHSHFSSSSSWGIFFLDSWRRGSLKSDAKLRSLHLYSYFLYSPAAVCFMFYFFGEAVECPNISGIACLFSSFAVLLLVFLLER